MDETRKLHVVYPNSLLWDLERLRGGLEGLGLGVILGKRDIALGDWRFSSYQLISEDVGVVRVAYEFVEGEDIGGIGVDWDWVFDEVGELLEARSIEEWFIDVQGGDLREGDVEGREEGFFVNRLFWEVYQIFGHWLPIVKEYVQ